MKRQTLNAVGVALVVLFAGTAVLTGATATSGERPAVSTVAASPVQPDSENVTDRANATIRTVELYDVTLTNVSLDHVHVVGNVTAGDETVLRTGNGTETVENITARQLFVASATLENVSLSELTVRNESIATALLGNRTADDGDVTVSNATLRNQTVEGVTIEHGTLGDVDVAGIRYGSTDAVAPDSDGSTPGEAAMEIYSASVDSATFGDASLAGLSVGNETAADETAEAGDGP